MSHMGCCGTTGEGELTSGVFALSQRVIFPGESVEEKDSWPRESVCNGKGMLGDHVVRCHFHIYSVSLFSLPMAPSMAILWL